MGCLKGSKIESLESMREGVLKGSVQGNLRAWEGLFEGIKKKEFRECEKGCFEGIGARRFENMRVAVLR